MPIAVIEAKRSIYEMGYGMQQALLYAEMIDAPFALSSNGEGFLLHDRTGITQPAEREIGLDDFPKFDELWPVYKQWKGIEDIDAENLVCQPYHADGSGKISQVLSKSGHK